MEGHAALVGRMSLFTTSETDVLDVGATTLRRLITSSTSTV